MTTKQIKMLQTAAMIIETDGAEGIQAAIQLVGENVAAALLIAHLRRGLGSMDTFPADDAIIEKVTVEVKRTFGIA